MVKIFSTEIIIDTTSFTSIVEVNWNSKEELISIQDLKRIKKERIVSTLLMLPF